MAISSDTNVRRTPFWVLNWLRDGLKLDIWCDVACDGEDNAVAGVWITKETDGLVASWSALQGMFLSRAAVRSGQCWMWCNPPYGRGLIGRWVAKALAEAEQGVQVAMLLPADLGTRWASRLMSVRAAGRLVLPGEPAMVWLEHQTVFFSGRLKFDEYEQGARFSSMLVFIGGSIADLPYVSVMNSRTGRQKYWERRFGD